MQQSLDIIASSVVYTANQETKKLYVNKCVHLLRAAGLTTYS